MTIYVSTCNSGLLQRPQVRKITNIFSREISPCPCGSEEVILRFGETPYLVCLGCGRMHPSGMVGACAINDNEKDSLPHILRYLEEWRRGDGKSPRLESFLTHGYYRSLFKIIVGGETSTNFSVEPVDLSFQSKIERLKGERR